MWLLADIVVVVMDGQLWGLDVKCSTVLFFFVFAEGQIVLL